MTTTTRLTGIKYIDQSMNLYGCVPLPEWTGMDIITGVDYRNGHYALALGSLNVFYLHKMYFYSHMSSLHPIKFISV